MEKTIIVKGESRILIKPDYIIINLEILSFNKNYNIALNESKLKYDSLLNSLVNLGFNNEDLKTNSFFVETIYENKQINNNYEKYFLGYKIHHQLTLGLYFDMNNLNKVINGIMNSVATPNYSIQFTVEDERPFLDLLLKNTILDTKNKANAIAENLGITLKNIINIDYTQKKFHIFSETQFAPKMLADQAINITPQKIELNDFITMLWEIDT